MQYQAFGRYYCVCCRYRFDLTGLSLIRESVSVTNFSYLSVYEYADSSSMTLCLRRVSLFDSDKAVEFFR